MRRAYRPVADQQPRFFGSLLGVAACFLIFLIIPLSQMLSESPESVPELRALPVSLPPPPPPPPEPPPPPPADERSPPDFTVPPALPTLEQIEVSLRPGTGGALAVGLGSGFSFETESVADLRDLFDFGELDEIPRIVQRGAIDYPASLRRAGTEGEVQLVVIIDEEGRTVVDEVLDFTHRAFIQAAVRGAESTRFSTPLRNGRPVRARYLWTIRFNLAN